MIRLLPPEPTTAQLKARAASGLSGCVAARKALQQRVVEQLRREVGAP